MKAFLFEVCAESVETAQAAELGGADRIELCSKLPIGGVTPEIELTRAAIRALSIPVHVLIRPRGGDFAFSTDEFDLMRRQIEQAKEAGAAGVVVGVLRPDGSVDVERTRELVKLGRPMSVTFHRSFDETSNLIEALEAVIETGADCLLTSGGAPDVLTGAESIAQLRRQAGERLAIMAAIAQPARSCATDGSQVSARIDEPLARGEWNDRVNRRKRKHRGRRSRRCERAGYAGGRCARVRAPASRRVHCEGFCGEDRATVVEHELDLLAFFKPSGWRCALRYHGRQPKECPH